MLTGLAPAAPPSEAELNLKKAQTYIDLGTALFEARDYAGALAELERAEPLVSNAGARAALRFNIARCLEELGRDAEAVTAFERYLEIPDDRRTQQRARRTLRRLSRRVYGALQVQCVPAAARARLIEVPGEPRPCPARFERLAPGTYTAEAIGEQHRAATEVSVAAGEDVAIDIRLPGSLTVRSAGAAGQVLLNAAPLGPAPVVRHAVAPGVYGLTVRAAGHRDWTTEVEIRPDGVTEVVAAPRPLPASDPLFGAAEPYVRWGAVGGAAVALAGAGWFWSRAAADLDAQGTAMARYAAATDPTEVERHRAASEAARGDAREHRALAWMLGGAGLALAGTATWLFLRRGEAPVVGLAPVDRGAAFFAGARW